MAKCYRLGKLHLHLHPPCQFGPLGFRIKDMGPWDDEGKSATRELSFSRLRWTVFWSSRPLSDIGCNGR